MYQEDFERERQAREAAVKVRNMVEERIIKKEKEVKELRERLNQQAMTTLSAEDQVIRKALTRHSLTPSPTHTHTHTQYDDSTDSNPVGSFRPQSRRLNAPPPDAHSLSPSPSQVRSGEHLMHTQVHTRTRTHTLIDLHALTSLNLNGCRQLDEVICRGIRSENAYVLWLLPYVISPLPLWHFLFIHSLFRLYFAGGTKVIGGEGDWQGVFPTPGHAPHTPTSVGPFQDSDHN